MDIDPLSFFGKVLCPNRNIEIHFTDRVDFGNSGSFILITGDNGAGKTTFIETVIIPRLLSVNKCVIYFGPDRIVQYWSSISYSAVKATVLKNESALFSQERSRSSKSVSAILTAITKCDYIIVDEFQLDMINDINRLADAFPNASIIVITHDIKSVDTFRISYKYAHLKFGRHDNICTVTSSK